MTEQQLLNKKIFLAPYNAQSIQLSEYLQEKFQFKIEGFLDSQKCNDVTSNYSDITLNSYDNIIILSPNYAKEIFATLLNLGHKKEKIMFALVKVNRENFNFYKTFLAYLLNIKLNPMLKDLLYLTGVSYLKLLRLKTIHKNQRVFIIGNGPSLKINDLEKLKNEITFAANKIYLSFDQTQWRPNYYFVVDKLVYSQNYEKIKELPLKKFFSIDMLDLGPKIQNSYYFPLKFKRKLRLPFLSSSKQIQKIHKGSRLPSLNADPLKGVAKGNTVVYSMAEFAIYMGAKEIYFLGVDFDFIVNDDKSSEDLRYTTHKGEHNHFHKGYRKIGEKWNKPNLPGIENSFKKLRQYCEDHNVKVYNATRGGKLEILERIDFDELFEAN